MVSSYPFRLHFCDYNAYWACYLYACFFVSLFIRITQSVESIECNALFLSISPYFCSIVFAWVPSLALFAARHREVSYLLIYLSNGHYWTWPVWGPVFAHPALAPRNLRESGLHFPAFGLHFARPGSILRIPGSILWDPLLGIGFWNPKSHKLWLQGTR